jgi:DNA-binding NtrC family response regulator
LKRRLLVVDDIPQAADFILETLRTQYEVIFVSCGKDAIEKIKTEPVDMVITDIAMPNMNGEDLTVKIKELRPEMPVLAITAYGSIENAVKLIKLGAFDYLEKPFTADRLRHVVGKAFEFTTLKKENQALQVRLSEHEKTKDLLGNSAQVQHVREKIKLVARTSATILITGESGTGKKIVASEIHRLSVRSNQPLVRISCASIPAAMLESELFGYEKGAFTGAVKAEQGKFELAHKGTILLDEIGELDHTLQEKLLHVIQDGEFDRVGGSDPVKVDVRIIATTKRNLKEETLKKRFREDLFYRLNVVPLEMPPLRERREDIPLLINHFNRIFSATNSTEPVTLTEGAVQKLCNAYWKDNVRQLQNVIERAVVLNSGMTLGEDYFQFENDREEQLSKIENAFRFGSIREMEKLMILDRLKDQKQNRTRSAETLDISVRTLRNKLNEYNVPRKASYGVVEETSPPAV